MSYCSFLCRVAEELAGFADNLQHRRHRVITYASPSFTARMREQLIVLPNVNAILVSKEAEDLEGQRAARSAAERVF